MKIQLPNITPAPWTLEAGRIFQTSSGRFSLSYGTDKATGNPHFQNFPELDQNARTIAALPQVLVALKELVERIHTPQDHTESTVDLQGSFFVEQAIAALKDAGAFVTYPLKFIPKNPSRDFLDLEEPPHD